MMTVMEMGKCYGQMEACMMENGKMEFSMVMEEWYLLMEQARKVILRIISLSIQCRQMIRIFKTVISKVKVFSNKQSKYK